ncbi:MAG: ATP-binding cassette domain-containing protein [Gemmatimonadetes bacterium]|nr:MAG: ATP-binding cassette domain-containing protein [Gemmatimonadota bacterium]
MIAVEGVTKRFGDLVAVDDISFTVQPGEVVGFLGPNGAGKTTTMRMLTGTLQPDAGSVLYDGVPIGDDLRGAKRRVGYLPESNPLYDDMLVAEYLEFAASLRGLEGPEVRGRIADAVDETGLGDVFYRPVGELSKGYRQRVGLAAAILHRPEILVLDEPTEGLDPNQRVDIRRLVSSLGRERTVLLSTHVMQEVEATCSRLLIVRRGRLVADGAVGELLAGGSAGASYTLEAEGEGVAEAVAKLPGVRSVAPSTVDGRTRLSVSADGERDLRPELFRLAAEQGWVLWELHRERASLEQLFRELTAEPQNGDGRLDDGGAGSEATAPSVEDTASGEGGQKGEDDGPGAAAEEEVAR